MQVSCSLEVLASRPEILKGLEKKRKIPEGRGVSDFGIQRPPQEATSRLHNLTSSQHAGCIRTGIKPAFYISEAWKIGSLIEELVKSTS